MKPTLLILAAGMGSRYGGLKQLDAVGPSGETIMDFSVFDAVRAGFGKAVFVIRPDFADAFKQGPGARFEKHLAVDYAYQELNKVPAWFQAPAGREKPWGTAHAVLMAKDLIREPFAMINADDFYGRESFEVVARFLEKGGPDYCMAGYRLKATLSENGTVARGVCKLGPDGYLEGVEELLKIEKTESGARDQETGRILGGDEMVSMNCFGFTPGLFAQIEALFDAFLKDQGQELKSEIYIPRVVDRLIQSHQARVQVLPSAGSWFGVTYREDKPLVTAGIQNLIAKGAYPQKLWA